MRICFISFEYPPDTGIGGIATHVRQAALLFSSRGIHVEVICASPVASGTVQEHEFLAVTKIRCSTTEEFRTRSPAIAASRHRHHPFDVIEVPEYGAEGLQLKDELPDVPLLVKLCTPGFLVKELNDSYYDKRLFRRMQRAAGMGYRRSSDPEYRAIQRADRILAPSRSLREIVIDRWDIPPEKVVLAPNPYSPSSHLLGMAPGEPADTVLYIGRLETRKGVYNLAKAVPLVVREMPAAKFIFLGRDCRGPFRERSMQAVMLREMGAAAGHATFIDHAPAEEVPAWLARAGSCVFPSLWENHPNVCLEAMLAGRGIVASREGGMTDMLEDIDGGILVDPHDPRSIAAGMITMIGDQSFRRDSARRGREKAVRFYGDRLVTEMIEVYRSVCSQAHSSPAMAASWSYAGESAATPAR